MKHSKQAKIIGKIVLSEEQHNRVKALGIHNVANNNPTRPDAQSEIVERIGNAEAIIVNISTKITSNVIKECPNLKFIQTWSAGVDHIDMDAAKRANITVRNAPDFSVQAVAEKAVGLMLLIANKLSEANKDALDGRWNYRVAT